MFHYVKLENLKPKTLMREGTPKTKTGGMEVLTENPTGY